VAVVVVVVVVVVIVKEKRAVYQCCVSLRQQSGGHGNGTVGQDRYKPLCDAITVCSSPPFLSCSRNWDVPSRARSSSSGRRAIR